MTEITLESIAKKLGFDPLNPPYPEVEPQVVDDYTPSIWAPLSREELAFLIKTTIGIDVYELEKSSQEKKRNE